MPAHLQFDIRAGTAARARRADDGAPMRLLLISDFGGRTQRETLASRRPLRVDIDNVDTVMRRIAPRLILEIGGATVDLELSSLDAFHPDRLCETVGPLRTLREMRERLHSGSMSAAATLGEDPSALLGRLLGRAPDAAAAPPSDPMQAWIHSLVAPHIVPAMTVDQQALERVDSSFAEPLRALPHAPAFRTLAAAWRGVHWLVSRLELNEDLQLHLLDATREELLASVPDAQGDPADSALGRLLGEPGAEGTEGPRWSLLVGLFSIGPDADDQMLLAGLGAIAASIGGPFVAAAEPALFGCSGVADLPEPHRWQPLAGDAAQRWSALRRSALAPWIGLVAPRLLMRLPYGRATDPTEGFDFEEQAATPRHDTLAWGPGSLAVALLLGQAFTESGWDLAPGQVQDVDDLPAYTFTLGGEAQLQPCAEAWLGERAALALLEQGVMPLLSHRQRASVRLARVQSIAEPAQALAGPWLG
jgi:type VI secretion system protein ImpC